MDTLASGAVQASSSESLTEIFNSSEFNQDWFPDSKGETNKPGSFSELQRPWFFTCSQKKSPREFPICKAPATLRMPHRILTFASVKGTRTGVPLTVYPWYYLLCSRMGSLKMIQRGPQTTTVFCKSQNYMGFVEKSWRERKRGTHLWKKTAGSIIVYV